MMPASSFGRRGGRQATRRARRHTDSRITRAATSGAIPTSRVQQPSRALFPDESHGEDTNVRFGASSARPEPRDDRPLLLGDSRLARNTQRARILRHDHCWIIPLTCPVDHVRLSLVLVHTESVKIVIDRDTRRAGPVRAAFLFARQSRRATPPRWREHRGLKTP